MNKDFESIEMSAVDRDDSMHFDESDQNDESAECPFCGATNESCKHLIACFGVSEAGIVSGILVDHQDELIDLMNGRSEGYEAASDIEDVIATLRAFLEQHAEVDWADFSVDEENGIWDYASYWARYPGMVIDELYRHLEAQASEY